VTPEVKLAVTLAGLTVGLLAFFWGIALFLQGYLYNQIADKLPVRAAVAALLVACGLTGWTLLNTRASHPDKYGVLFGFDRMMTPTSTREVGEFEAVRQLGRAGPRGEFEPLKDDKGQPREQRAKFVWDGQKGFVEAGSREPFKLNTSTYMTTSLLVPDGGEPAKFDAVLENGRYTAGKPFADPAGRTVEGEAPRQMVVPSGSAMAVGLLVNAGHFLLWVAAFWLGLRFAFGHSVGLAAVFGGMSMVVLMPLLFAANTPKPQPPGLVAPAKA
jgi:hypothetical protein